MCIDSNKRLPLLLATAIVGMVNICNAVPAVGAPMLADSNAVSFVGISRDAEGAHAVDVGDGTYGFAGLTAETGVGIAAGVAVGLYGSDVALAGYYTMVNGLPQDTLTSQGLQAVGVPQDWANGIDVGVSVAGTMGVGAAARGVGTVTRATGEQTEIVQRWMSQAELRATEKTGLLRGGRSGTHCVSPHANSDPFRARQRLALDHTPEIRVSLEVPAGVFSRPTSVQPAFGMPGGGLEQTASGMINVKIIKVYK